MSKPTQAEVVKVIAKMVQEGKLEYCIVDGKPGVRLVEPKK